MEYLWKKESDQPDAPYTDLLSKHLNEETFKAWSEELSNRDKWKHCYRDLQLVTVKSNTWSSMLRTVLGNKEFKSRMYDSAMEYYNQSLIFAEPGTENVSIAYANRSACFLEMQMYDKCLIDIDLAEKAKYPERFRDKLEKRKAECLTLMQNHESKRYYEEPKLSFDTNKKFPCMASVLTIKKNDEFGRYVEANRDIDVGRTVLVEQRFTWDIVSLDRVFCFTCMKECMNFIPCPQCTDVVFCNDDCMNRNHIHKLSCGATFYRVDPQTRLSVKSVLLAIAAFPNVEALMSFVEITLAKGNEIPQSTSDLQSNYSLYLTLYKAPIELDMLFIYKVYTSIMDIPSVNILFDSKAKQNFLMHLVGQHFLIEKTNGHGDDISGSMTNVLSLFNHSCAPNLYNMHMDNREILVTTRPIKKGEQLFIAYLGFGQTTEERQEILKKQYEFDCKCDKCVPHCSLSDRERMKCHESFKYLMKNLAATGNIKSSERRRKQKCIEFLNKFGYLPWSEELDAVIDAFETCVSKDLILF